MTLQTNVAEVERWASALGGAALAAYGISQIKNRSIAGAALAAAGGTLIYRGATGHCPMYAAAGISTAGDDFDTRVQLSGTPGVNIDEVITIYRPADEVYGFWSHFAAV